jgi:putative transcriptional regulator
VAPAAGQLLVASPGLDGSWFERSVVLLLDYGAQGSVGLVLDRPSHLALAGLLPDIGELRTREDALFLGGPVEPAALFLLLSSPTPPPESQPLLGDIHVSRSIRALRDLLRKDAAGGRFRAYAGYAGWASGQLDAEVARGDWLIAPGTTESIFAERPHQLWRQLVLEHGGIQVRAPKSRSFETAGRYGPAARSFRAAIRGLRLMYRG